MRRISLEEWDEAYAPWLRAAHDRAKRLSRTAGEQILDANEIVTFLGHLTAVPEFETQARAALDDVRRDLTLARKEIDAAMDAVEKAMTEYDAKEKVK